MSKKILRIDSHTHILPNDWPDFKEKFGYGGFIQLEHHVKDWARMMKDDGTFFREVEADLWDAKARLEYMDNMGIDVQVCCTVPTMFSYWAKPEDTLAVCKILNDDLAKTCATYPKRFIGLGTLPMQAPALAVEEVKRCVKDLGLAGFQIGSHIEDMTLDDPKLFPIFEAIAESGACLMVHPWDMIGRKLMKRYWLPWLVSMPAETSLAICSFIFGGIFERLPKLRVMFAHAGGSFPATVGRVKHGYDCRPDLCARDNKHCPTEYMGKFWVDHLTHSKEQLGAVMNLIGSDRICFGTDYPFPLGECYPLKKPGELIYQKNDLTHAQMQQMLGENTLEWLGVDASKYMGNINRENRLPEAVIMSKTNEKLVGKYICKPNDIELTLLLEGSKCKWLDPKDGSCREGTWEVGTYTRQGDVNRDVNVIFSNTGDKAASKSVNSEWSAYQHVKIVLNEDGKTCEVVEQFKFENLKRCSGHNTLLEGEVRPIQPKLKRKRDTDTVSWDAANDIETT